VAAIFSGADVAARGHLRIDLTAQVDFDGRVDRDPFVDVLKDVRIVGIAG
jgi:hypothetical protein